MKTTAIMTGDIRVGRDGTFLSRPSAGAPPAGTPVLNGNNAAVLNADGDAVLVAE